MYGCILCEKERDEREGEVGREGEGGREWERERLRFKRPLFTLHQKNKINKTKTNTPKQNKRFQSPHNKKNKLLT